VAQTVDFSFVRDEVAQCYGSNGHESVDPVVLLKMIFLLFYDNVASERQLMDVIPERLDYLWFLGYGLDDQIPNHSVLSKARRRWGKEVFEQLFVRTVEQCVQARLVSGDKLHVAASMIAANASKDSVIKSSPELIAACAAAYEAQEKRSMIRRTSPALKPSMMWQSERPILMRAWCQKRVRQSARLSSSSSSGQRTRSHYRRGDNQREYRGKQEVERVDGPDQQNTCCEIKTVIADHKYGTAKNFVLCHQRGVVTHLGDAKAKRGKVAGIFSEEQFQYEGVTDTYLCPAGQSLRRRRYVRRQRVWEHAADRKTCAGCILRAQCTRGQAARTISRHEAAGVLEVCRTQAHSAAAKRDRQRR
jgi:transposase